MFRQLNKSAIR